MPIARPKRLTKRERERLDLLRGFGLWLGNQGYQVGLTPQAIPPSAMVSLAKALVPYVPVLTPVGATIPALADCFTGGTEAQELARRLEPLRDIVDLVGILSEAQAVTAVTVVFADELPTDRLLARYDLLDQFSRRLAELATFRVPLLWSTFATLEVVYVLFEAARCASRIDALLQDGRRDASGRLVRASCLDLESEVVSTAAAHGGWAAIRELVEDEESLFGPEDVPLILELARAARERDS